MNELLEAINGGDGKLFGWLYGKTEAELSNDILDALAQERETGRREGRKESPSRLDIYQAHALSACLSANHGLWNNLMIESAKKAAKAMLENEAI